MKRPVLYNGDDTETALPFKWQICPRCNGHNVSTAHVEGDGGGITAEEMQEAGDDFREAYFRGDYDRPCPHCDGGKVMVADTAKMTKAQRKAWREQERDDRDYERICEMERRMGA